MKFIFVPVFVLISSLVLTMPHSAWSAKQEIVEFYDCEGQTLKVELNVNDESSKTDLIDALQIFTDYPSLEIAPVYSSDPDSPAFSVSVGDHCDNNTCAVLSGWNELQWRLKLIPGTQASCMDLEKGEASQEEGGVIGSN